MADKAFYSLLVDLKANVANLQRDMDSAVGVLEKFGNRANQIITGAFVGLGEKLSEDLVGKVKELGGALTELADKGEQVSSVTRQFEALGGSSEAIEDARKKLLGTVEALDLMKIANEGLIRRIPDLNKNFAMLAEYAGRFAASQGRDAKEVLQELIEAVSKASPKALVPFGVAVDSTKTRTERMKEAIDGLRDSMDHLAPMTDTVSKAHKAFLNSLEGVENQVGLGINESEGLRDAYRAIAEEIEKVDWHQVGVGIGEVAGAVAQLVVQLAPAIEKLAQFVNLAGFLMQNGSALSANSQLNDLKGQLSNMNSVFGGKPGGVAIDDLLGTNMFGASRASWDRQRQTIQDEIAKEEGSATAGMFGVFGNMFQGLGLLGPKSQSADPLGPLNNGLDKAGQKIQALKDRWSELMAKGEENSLKDALEQAIKYTDQVQFDSLKEKLRASVEKGFIEGHKEFLKAGISMGELQEQAAKESSRAVKEYEQKMLDAQNKVDEERIKANTEFMRQQAESEQKLIDMEKQRAQDLGTAFDNLFSKFGLDSEFSKAASDLAGNIASGLMSNLKENQGGFFGLGQTIASGLASGMNYLFGDASGTGASHGGANGTGLAGVFDSMNYSMGGTSGDGMTTAQAHQAGIQGPGASGDENASFNGGQGTNYGGYVMAGATVAGAAMNARAQDRANKDNRGTGSAVGSGIGGIIGGVFGGGTGAQIGASIGKGVGDYLGRFFGWGASNPETQARHSVANYLEDAFKQMGEVIIYDLKNNPHKFDGNFMEGATTRFNQPGWAATNQQAAGSSWATFEGLGQALKELQGITQDVGSEIGAMLGQNLAYNVDNARMLVQRLGLSFGDVEQKLVDVGKQGTRSWHEIEVELQGVSDAFKPGLKAVGAFSQAWDNLINSGGRGFDAIQSLRNIGVEALEAHIKTFDQLRASLIAAGKSPEEVTALFTALAQRGITSIDQLSNATDRVAGGVVADMESLGVKWKDVQDTVDQVSQSIDKIPDQTQKNITLNWQSNFDDNTQKAMDSGLTNASGIDVPQAPSAPSGTAITRSLSLIQGGRGGTTINVDARGAAPGVEHVITRAMRETEDRVVQRIAKSADHYAGRSARA